MIIPILSGILILLGLLFFFGAGVGLLRFPDYYTRMHAAGKGDSLGAVLVIAGFALYQLHGIQDFSADWSLILVGLKLLVIVGFLYISSATSTSALAEAGWEDDIDPIIEPGREGRMDQTAAAEFRRKLADETPVDAPTSPTTDKTP